MSFRHEVIPFLIAGLIASGLVAITCKLIGINTTKTLISAGILCVIINGYFLYFFRNPERIPPTDTNMILAGADGTIAKICTMSKEEFTSAAQFCGLNAEQTESFLKPKVVRISIFLSLFDVHVNRTPISGNASFLGYFPGKHLFTFDEKSSDVNQHNAILVTNKTTSCMITQIVGPICRRVIYWHDHNKEVPLTAGDTIGMMKFGSRMDMYFPSEDIEIITKIGDKVTAGITTIAKLRKESK